MAIATRDYIIGAIAGLVTGVLAFFIFRYLAIDFYAREIILFAAIPALWAAGVWLGKFLSRRFPFFAQFGKFAVVGFLGAAIDFSVLNFLSASTGITAGFVLGWINVPGFLVATTNNYFWNKLWVFKNQTEFGSVRDPNSVWDSFPKFLGVTVIGLLINSGIIVLLTTLFAPPFGFSSAVWLNGAKIVANAVAMIWNFLGYKFIVFRHESR